MRRLNRIVFVALLAASALTVVAAPRAGVAQVAAEPAFAAVKRQAIEAAAKRLSDEYIFPDKGAQAAALIRQNLAAGKYDSTTTPGDFAEQVTKDLLELTHDRHLRIMGFGPPPAPPPAKEIGPSDPPRSPPPSPGHVGLIRIDRLKGNIGYIQLDEFMPKGGFKRGADSAMALIASTDALIIDLRNNHGGDVAAVAYLDSFFFDGKTPVHIGDIIWRKAGTVDFDRQAFVTQPTPVSYLGKPVYLIIGPDTFSGGEAFAYDMKVEKRATLIGEATAGGANPGGFWPIGPGLMMFLPNGRVENATTHSNWEGVGVQPDEPLAADKSFAATYAAAFHALGRAAPTSADTPDAVLEAHLPLPAPPIPTPGSEAATRRWEAGMAEGQPPYDLFTEEGAAQARKEVTFLKGDLGHRGAIQTLTFAGVDPYGGDIYDLTFVDGSAIQLTIFLSLNGKIETVVGQPY